MRPRWPLMQSLIYFSVFGGRGLGGVGGGGLLLSSYADFSAFSTEEGGRGVSKGIPENRMLECQRRIWILELFNHVLLLFIVYSCINTDNLYITFVHEITHFRVPACSQILSPWLGDKVVEYGIGLPYWPASQCSLAGLYDNPMP